MISVVCWFYCNNHNLNISIFQIFCIFGAATKLRTETSTKLRNAAEFRTETFGDSFTAPGLRRFRAEAPALSPCILTKYSQK